MSAIFESLLAAEIAAPQGPLRLRRETAQDEAFRFALFCDSRPELAMLSLEAAMKERLMRQQFLAQSAGYSAQFPNALTAMVEQGAAPIGRLVLDESGARLHIVDIAFLPALRGKGAGTALLRALMARGNVLSLRVSRINAGAARLYLRLGFKPVAEDGPNIEMEWRG